MLTYRRHNCDRRHRTNRAFAKCIWPHATWIQGDGPYALLARCGHLTITLHEDEPSAQENKAVIDHTGCGGKCHGDHQVILLEREVAE